MNTTQRALPDTAFQLDKLDQLIRQIAERSEKFDRELDAQPQALPCAKHGPKMRILDREASRQAAKPAYTCAACVQDQRVKRSLGRVEEAGIPTDVRHATLDNFHTDRPGVKKEHGFQPPTAFLEAARQFAEGRMRNLFLAGTPGIGKGHLAAALSRQEILKGRSVRWVECARLFAACHRAYSADGMEAVIARYTAPALLVLDELCLRDLPSDGEEILFAILDHRHKNARRTLLLGNKPAQETRAWIGDRISDRLRSGGVTFCYGEWQSARGTDWDGSGF
ncbi:DNA replication protein DnaC [Prosthecobacter fusiformis]|uniref:DNA replication protein DnaC n=1 Tax=Prosthecobacter fusiformis TaxID=48464 RepID=A0A4R7STQ5_9BACT|nr:ATP-binding protein [Prosthecobacter fusiformis]TDU81638.1 DNA replication protein DnaC [Prosthecobacter fusiformis]